MIRRTLPTTVNPPDTICLQLQVPNDPHYIAAVWGAIFDLTSAIGWENDAAHTAILAARRMRQMYVTAQLGNCPPPNTGPGFFLEDCMNIKQDPDNPCLLREVCPDGSLGCVIFDASKCTPNPAPGAGTTPPGPGGVCQDYQMQIDTHLVTLMPFVVNTGDTLALDSAVGASTDGANWYCPDGEFFVLGACFGGAHTVPGSPVPTKPFMKLIWKIGANYYDATTAPFAVPGGVTNAQVWLQVNNSSLTSVGGTEQVKLTFCNNQANTSVWCKHIDFTAIPGGFSALTGLDGNGQVYGPAFWGAGQGWAVHPQQPPPAGSQEYYFELRLDLGANFTFTDAAFAGHVFHATGGTFEEMQVRISTMPDFSGGNTMLLHIAPLTSNADFGGSNTVAPALGRYIQFYGIGYSFTGADDPILELFNVTFKGQGASPFGASNC